MELKPKTLNLVMTLPTHALPTLTEQTTEQNHFKFAKELFTN